MSARSRRRLVLVGAGHAHLEVVRRLAEAADVSATLITPSPQAAYSGMLPGLIAGHYRHEQAHVALEPLCARSGVVLRVARAVALDAHARTVLCDDGEEIHYDVASIATGSLPHRDGIPGAAEHAVAIKPIPAFLERWRMMLAEAPEGGRSIVVIGGGPGGVEVVLAMHHRLTAGPDWRAAGSDSPRFSLVSASLLEGHPERAREMLERVLHERGIRVVHDEVARLTDRAVHTASGAVLDADLAILVTGPAPPAWLAGSGLATDAAGFVAVDRFLQSISHPEVLAAGDAATIVGSPAPKSGVYAVRAGPVLHDNLRAALAGRPAPTPFRPQRHALSLISTGDRRAILTYGPLVMCSRWLWTCKDCIDRRFVSRYSPG